MISRWMKNWLVLSMLIVFWDISFIFLRPYSMPGGDLHFLWIPYLKYISIDLSYGDLNDPFVPAQAILSLVEITLGLVVLWWSRIGKQIEAGLLLMVVSSLTAAKTALILVLEWTSGFENTGHNTWWESGLFYGLPNVVWIIFPTAVALCLARRFIANSAMPLREQ